MCHTRCRWSPTWWWNSIPADGASALSGTVVVTGGSRGIGAAVCRLLGAAGAAVAVNYAARADAAEAVAEDVRRAGGRAATIRGDMADETDIKALFAQAEAQLGPITGLVNNAGITGPVLRTEDTTAAVINQVLALNVTGALLCAREAIRRMSTKHGGKGGAIVNLSSRAAGLGGPGEWVPYAASKGAIDSITIGLSKELAAEGIRVNAVAPGLIDTDIHAAGGDAGRLARLGPSVPLGRVGTAEETAHAILFLLSPQSAYITGTILHVSGGR